MKRHPALVPLSRDHHHALVIAQRLRRATVETATEAARAFLSHWDAEENAQAQPVACVDQRVRGR